MNRYNRKSFDDRLAADFFFETGAEEVLSAQEFVDGYFISLDSSSDLGELFESTSRSKTRSKSASNANIGDLYLYTTKAFHERLKVDISVKTRVPHRFEELYSAPDPLEDVSVLFEATSFLLTWNKSEPSRGIISRLHGTTQKSPDPKQQSLPGIPQLILPRAPRGIEPFEIIPPCRTGQPKSDSTCQYWLNRDGLQL